MPSADTGTPESSEAFFHTDLPLLSGAGSRPGTGPHLPEIVQGEHVLQCHTELFELEHFHSVDLRPFRI